jgi:hypothetical protein
MVIGVYGQRGSLEAETRQLVAKVRLLGGGSLDRCANETIQVIRHLLAGLLFTERTSGSTSMGSISSGTGSRRSGDVILRRLACW